MDDIKELARFLNQDQKKALIVFMDKIRELAKLLDDAGSSSDNEIIKSRAGAFFDTIQPEVESGSAGGKVSKPKAKRKPSKRKKIEKGLPLGHLVKKIIIEHEMFEYFVSSLAELSREISDSKDFWADNLLERLGHLSWHLNGFEEHDQLEELIIFPQLEKAGYSELTNVFCVEHMNIERTIHKLGWLVESALTMNFNYFKQRLVSVVDLLGIQIRDHVKKENDFLTLMVTDILPDEKLWSDLKVLAEEVGFCIFHLHDVPGKNDQ